MSGIGHNRGPGMEPGASWRVHCWRKARADLLPQLPLEVIRLRVRRAAEIGLDYPTYATIRASSGHDLIAFLFSSNALRMLRDSARLPPDRAAKLLAQQNIARHLAAQPPLDPAQALATLGVQGATFDSAIHAPELTETWGQVGTRLRGLFATARHPADRVLLIGDTGWERTWAEAGRMAGYLPADRFFAPRAG